MTANSPPMNLKRVTRRLAPLLLLFFLAACFPVGPPPDDKPPPPPSTTKPAPPTTTKPAPLLPDVVVVSVSTSPVNPIQFDEVTFSAVVRNDGTAPTPQGTAIGVSFSVDRTNDGNVVSWSDTDHTSLLPGQTVTLTPNSGPGGRKTWRATPGAHSVTAWVDNINRFSELNESNNQTTLAFSAATLVAPPSPPTVHLVVGTTECFASWGIPPDDVRVTGWSYSEFFQTADGQYHHGVVGAHIDLSDTSTPITRGAPDDAPNYIFSVAAYNQAGESAYADMVCPRRSA